MEGNRKWVFKINERCPNAWGACCSPVIVGDKVVVQIKTMIALNLADRMQVDPFMLMQNMYVVHGRPGIEGKLAIALVEGSGRFSPLKYSFDGEGKTDKGIDRPESCFAYATELKTGEVIEGPPVTWQMAVAEGWTKARGEKEMTPKWQTMPDLMFRYRAAMFFARVNCPGALLGLRSVEEIEDIEMVPAGEGLPYQLAGDRYETAAEEKKEPVSATVKKKKAPEPEKREDGQAEPAPKKDKAVNDTLAEELAAYCPDETMRPALLKQITAFTKDGETKWADDITKMSNKWAGAALGKLRGLAKKKGGDHGEQTVVPANCPKNPRQCDSSGWRDGRAYCGPDGAACQFNEVK
jgi:hypothetical protein